MSALTPRFGSPATLSWGLCVALVAMAIAIAAGIAALPVVLLASIVAIFLAFRYIYVMFYLGILLMPMLGLVVSVSTGDLLIGQRASGGSVDVSLAEVVFLCVIFAWSMKMLLLWKQRRDHNWKPHWPLLGAYLPLVGAHIASIASPLLPDPYLVLKFALRPVLFVYLAFVALPYNLIKSRRRLIAALGTFSAVGMLAALNGLLAMFFPENGEFLGRAHPLSIFGVPVLGENHNELAEMMVVTAPITLALTRLVKSTRDRQLLMGAAVFQFTVGIFTFTRTLWIVFIFETAFLIWTMWRAKARRHLSSILLGIVLILPFAIGMVFYTLSQTAQSSNSTRLMLSQIAAQVFESSPVFGGGAGSYTLRVGSTQLFLLEYGDPIDSHGFIQKLAEETGALGLLALGIFLVCVFRYVRIGMRDISAGPVREAALLMIAASGGAFIYQLFNTSYWNGKMWLPLGLLIAAVNVLRSQGRGSEASEHGILDK